MGILLILAIPVVGQIMFVVWAFYGDNESRKNYFRAIFAWIFVCLALMIAVVLINGGQFRVPIHFQIPVKQTTK
jgi:hypothetical protein